MSVFLLSRCRRERAALLMVCTCAAASPLRAQELQLSLPEALSRADARAPDVVLADSSVREVEARRAGAGLLLPTNPRLAVEARPPFQDDAFAALGYAATLDVTFDLGGAPAARVREVERDVELSRAERNAKRIEARLRVFTSYAGAQLAQLRIDDARAAIEIAKRVLHAAQTRIDVGAGSDFERASAQLELSRSEVAELAAQRERDEQWMALREALDLTAELSISLTTRIDVPAALQALATYLGRAQKSHPDIVVSAARLRSLAASREKLERETFPRLGLYAGVDAAPKSPVFGVLGVTGELPFVQRNQGPRAVVARAIETELTRRELQARRISRAVTAAWSAHEQRRAELDVLTSSALPAAERSFELAEAGWRAGRFDWFRVALAARDVIAVRAERVDALAALWLQRLVLARATGGDVP